MNNQIPTQKEILNLLKEGGEVVLKLTGVSFGNRQNIIKEIMRKDIRKVKLVADKVNPYDDYAIYVQIDGDKQIGFIPKKGGFAIYKPKRRRPLGFKWVVDEHGQPLQTNQIFYDLAKQDKLHGEIEKFLNYGSDEKVPIGVKIKFWLE